MTTRVARWFRRAEITLWVIGLSLLGGALAASVHRWSYQQEQERALMRTMAATQLAPRERVAVAQERSLLAPAEEADRFGSRTSATEAIGPPAPEAEISEPAVSTPETGASEAAASPREPEGVLDPDVIGRIEIPRLRLAAIVREGDDEETLDRAVGYIPGTALPGRGGNTALAGHRDTFFRPLRRIKVDDRIRLVVPPHTYEYRVESTRVVEPDAIDVLESTGSEELTLLTCYPFRFIGPAPQRFVVKATRVE